MEVRAVALAETTAVVLCSKVAGTEVDQDGQGRREPSLPFCEKLP